jgi:hypothetical protein
MEWGVKENHVAVFALHNCGKSYSQIFKFLKPWKISHMFIYQEIKHYEELSRVEDRAQSGHLKNMRSQDDTKTVQERIHRNLLWKREIMSRELKILTDPINVAPHQGRPTHDSALPFKGPNPYSCFKDDQTDKSRASPPLKWRETGTKTSSSQTRKSSPSRSSTTTKQQDLCSNIP